MSVNEHEQALALAVAQLTGESQTPASFEEARHLAGRIMQATADAGPTRFALLFALWRSIAGCHARMVLDIGDPPDQADEATRIAAAMAAALAAELVAENQLPRGIFDEAPPRLRAKELASERRVPRLVVSDAT